MPGRPPTRQSARSVTERSGKEYARRLTRRRVHETSPGSRPRLLHSALPVAGGRHGPRPDEPLGEHRANADVWRQSGRFRIRHRLRPERDPLRRQLPRRLREHGRRRLETLSPGPATRWIDSSRLRLFFHPRPTGLARHDARGPLGRRRLPYDQWRPDLGGHIGRRRISLDGQHLGLPAGRLCVGDARRVRRHLPIGRRRHHLECAPGPRALAGSCARGRPDVERRRLRLRRRLVGRPARRGLPFDRRRRRVVPPLRRPCRRRLHGVRHRSLDAGNGVCGLE